MDGKNIKKRIGRLQNTAILLLSLSALILFFYSFSPAIRSELADLSALFSSRSQSISLSEDETTATLSAPVQVAVTGQHGRFGCVAALGDEALISLNTLLKEALGSAGTASAATEEAFRKALGTSGIYYHLTTPIPLPSLCSMLDASTPTAPMLSVCRLLLAADAQSVRLFYYDGISYYVSSTAISPGTLESAIIPYEPNDTAFLFERSDFDHQLDPYTLITEDMASRPGFDCTVPPINGDNAQLLAFLGFNAHSNSRYVESDGTEVIFGSDATMRIEPDGTVTYAGTQQDASVFSVDGTGSSAAIGAAYRIAAGILLPNAGDASLYLDSCQETESGYIISFNYMAAGIPIRFHGDFPAASVVVSDGMITAFTLHCRTYTANSDTLRPLPLTQAIAIAAEERGILSISYVDSGANTLSAAWIVMQ